MASRRPRQTGSARSNFVSGPRPASARSVAARCIEGSTATCRVPHCTRRLAQPLLSQGCMTMRFAMFAGITLFLSASLPTADAAPPTIKCGATVTGAAVLTADLVCPTGHGLVVRSGAVLDCAGHRVTGGDRTGQYGIYVRDGAGAVVRNCVAERFEVGIRVRGMRGGVLKKNVAQDNLRYGIEVTQGSTAIRIAKKPGARQWRRGDSPLGARRRRCRARDPRQYRRRQCPRGDLPPWLPRQPHRRQYRPRSRRRGDVCQGLGPEHARRQYPDQ